MYYRATVFRPSPLQWICREWVQKLGFDEATACFGNEKHTESGDLTPQGEGTPRLRTGMRQPLSITQEPPSCFWASLFLGLLLLPGRSPLWVVFVVLYSSLPFFLLLHLSVIHTYPQVHVPSVILSDALWAAVAPIALSRGYIHINGVRVLVVCI